jgi:hypothetical protein
MPSVIIRDSGNLDSGKLDSGKLIAPEHNHGNSAISATRKGSLAVIDIPYLNFTAIFLLEEFRQQPDQEARSQLSSQWH